MCDQIILRLIGVHFHTGLMAKQCSTRSCLVYLVLALKETHNIVFLYLRPACINGVKQFLVAYEQLANVGHAQLRQQHIHQSAVTMFRRTQRIQIRGMIGRDRGPRAPMVLPMPPTCSGRYNSIAKDARFHGPIGAYHSGWFG